MWGPALAWSVVLRRLDLRGSTDDPATLLPSPTTGGSGPVEAVAAIVAEVAANGDAALRAFTERFDGVRIDELIVPAARVEAACGRIDPSLRSALEVSARRVRAFHEHQFAQTTQMDRYVDDTGLVIDTVFRPVEAAACYVPGGLAVYPSTVLHTAVPARVAGVERVVVCVPPQSDGTVPDVTLAACAIAGVDEVVPVGGAQAIAGMAFGTETIRPVDVIVGPGNIYVALAKRAVADRVGIPNAFAGPSEVVVVADDTAPVDLVALDLLVQAEHGPLGLAWCVTWDAAVADAVVDAVTAAVAVAARRTEIEATLAENGYVVVCDSPEQALDVVNTVAPEHLEVQVADPAAFVAGVRNAGAVFCGPDTPASLGDYVAGPSHVLPTHRTARYGQVLGVGDFLKEMHIVTADRAAFAALGGALATLAEAEGLWSHAASATRRLER